MDKKSHYWDPTTDQTHLIIQPSWYCLGRIADELPVDPAPGIFAVRDVGDVTLIHALLTGLANTPYEGGFFYFLIRCPPSYPIRPPRVKLMTTGEGKVQFNPSLYKSGKVCMSMIGTWSLGPPWSSFETLSTVLLSIQSLMNETPYFLQQNRGEGKNHEASELYNEIIRHETLRVAVCDMIEGVTDDTHNCPQNLRDIMENSFQDFYGYYEAQAMSKLHTDKQPMVDPFGDDRGFFDYSSILQRLQAIKANLDEKNLLETSDDSS